MMNVCRGILTAAVILFALATNASAALITSTGLIANLRIEGTVGFIGLSQSMATNSTCGARVWVDMNTPIGRSIYATALAAFVAKQPVTIRAAEESARHFGECNLYDIYVAR